MKVFQTFTRENLNRNITFTGHTRPVRGRIKETAFQPEMPKAKINTGFVQSNIIMSAEQIIDS